MTDSVLRTYFDALPVPELLVDRQGTVVEYNAAAAGRLRRFCGECHETSVWSRPLWSAPDVRPDTLRSWWLRPHGVRDGIPAGVGWQTELDNGMRKVSLFAPVPPDHVDVQTMEADVDLLPLWLRAMISAQPVSFFASDRAGVCRIAGGGLLTRFGLRPGHFLGFDLSEAEAAIGVPIEKHMRRAAEGDTFDDSMSWMGVDFTTHWAPWLDRDGNGIGGLVVLTPHSAADLGAAHIGGETGLPPASPLGLPLPGRSYLLSRRGDLLPVRGQGQLTELRSSDVRSVLGPDGADAVLPRLAEVLDEARTVTVEYCATGEGDERRTEAHIMPYHGDIALLTVNDATDRLERDRARRQAQRLEELGRLAAGVAHEINTPIQYISDNVGFLNQSFADLTGLLDVYRTLMNKDTELSWDERAEVAAEAEQRADVDFLFAEVPQAAAETLDGINRVATIVRAMKTFGHPAGEEMTAADLNDLLRSALVLSRSEYKHLADVVTDFHELPPITGDPGELHQVFVNLLVNAAHAVEDVDDGQRGEIRVSTRSEPDGVVVVVGDSGCGMTAEVRDHMFDLFFTTKAVGRGTGQGLSFVHASVVDRHGGSITVDSTVGRGTSFELRFPQAAPSGPAGQHG